MCPHTLDKIRDFQYNTARKYTINTFINCNTKFVVYYILYVCKQIYVGSTIRPVKEKIQEHIRAIRNANKDYPLAIHFNENMVQRTTFTEIPWN